VNDSITPLNLLLILNSLLIIGFILTQNESAKDLVANQNSSSSKNPFENFTWIAFFLQLFLLLIKVKTLNF
jgi:preprotein translocase subunit SecG